jgi:hypothetical protein
MVKHYTKSQQHQQLKSGGSTRVELWSMGFIIETLLNTRGPIIETRIKRGRM